MSLSTQRQGAGRRAKVAADASGDTPTTLAAPTKVPQPHGGALYSGGAPGHKGAGGRPPNWLRDLCDDLLADRKVKQQVRAILHDKDHPAFSTMWKAVADRAKGKPQQALEVSGKDGASLLPLALVRAIIADDEAGAL